MKIESYRNIFDNLIHDIKNNNCSFLVGAGISMLPPCSLPSGAELKNLALENLLGHQDLLNYTRKIKNHPKYISIVPEVLFQRFYEALREELYPFFNVLNYANANLAHKSLAFITDQYDLKIFTTNFDLLIDEYLNFKNNVIHLHGSLDDLSQMMIRINQVGRGLETNFKNILQKELSKKTLYILGYSGNDKDIIKVDPMSRLILDLFKLHYVPIRSLISSQAAASFQSGCVKFFRISFHLSISSVVVVYPAP